MPEIPEMEIYRDFLNRYVSGKQVTGVQVERTRSINRDVGEFIRLVRGVRVEKVERRAKFLVFHLDNDLYLLNHMMLDGRLYYGPPGLDREAGTEPAEPGMENGQFRLPGKAHVVFALSDNRSLYFCDLRLGYLHLLDGAELAREISDLGIEPLSSDYNWAGFAGLLSGRRGKIKPFLIAQKYLAGLGNAYSNEVLFASGIMPDRAAGSLTEAEQRRLFDEIPRTLREAISLGGYIEEPFTAGDSLSGGYIPHFRVYDRGGEPCLVCGTPISEKKLSGRWTYYCVRCQH